MINLVSHVLLSNTSQRERCIKVAREQLDAGFSVAIGSQTIPDMQFPNIIKLTRLHVRQHECRHCHACFLGSSGPGLQHIHSLRTFHSVNSFV